MVHLIRTLLVHLISNTGRNFSHEDLDCVPGEKCIAILKPDGIHLTLITYNGSTLIKNKMYFYSEIIEDVCVGKYFLYVRTSVNHIYYVKLETQSQSSPSIKKLCYNVAKISVSGRHGFLEVPFGLSKNFLNFFTNSISAGMTPTLFKFYETEEEVIISALDDSVNIISSNLTFYDKNIFFFVSGRQNSLLARGYNVNKLISAKEPTHSSFIKPVEMFRLPENVKIMSFTFDTSNIFILTNNCKAYRLKRNQFNFDVTPMQSPTKILCTAFYSTILDRSGRFLIVKHNSEQGSLLKMFPQLNLDARKPILVRSGNGVFAFYQQYKIKLLIEKEDSKEEEKIRECFENVIELSLHTNEISDIAPGRESTAVLTKKKKIIIFDNTTRSKIKEITFPALRPSAFFMTKRLLYIVDTATKLLVIPVSFNFKPQIFEGVNNISVRGNAGLLRQHIQNKNMKSSRTRLPSYSWLEFKENESFTDGNYIEIIPLISHKSRLMKSDNISVYGGSFVWVGNNNEIYGYGANQKNQLSDEAINFHQSPVRLSTPLFAQSLCLFAIAIRNKTLVFFGNGKVYWRGEKSSSSSQKQLIVEKVTHHSHWEEINIGDKVLDVFPGKDTFILRTLGEERTGNEYKIYNWQNIPLKLDRYFSKLGLQKGDEFKIYTTEGIYIFYGPRGIYRVEKDNFAKAKLIFKKSTSGDDNYDEVTEIVPASDCTLFVIGAKIYVIDVDGNPLDDFSTNFIGVNNSIKKVCISKHNYLINTSRKTVYCIPRNKGFKSNPISPQFNNIGYMAYFRDIGLMFCEHSVNLKPSYDRMFQMCKRILIITDPLGHVISKPLMQMLPGKKFNAIHRNIRQNCFIGVTGKCWFWYVENVGLVGCGDNSKKLINASDSKSIPKPTILSEDFKNIKKLHCGNETIYTFTPRTKYFKMKGFIPSENDYSAETIQMDCGWENHLNRTIKYLFPGYNSCIIRASDNTLWILTTNNENLVKLEVGIPELIANINKSELKLVSANGVYAFIWKEMNQFVIGLKSFDNDSYFYNFKRLNIKNRRILEVVPGSNCFLLRNSETSFCYYEYDSKGHKWLDPLVFNEILSANISKLGMSENFIFILTVNWELTITEIPDINLSNELEWCECKIPPIKKVMNIVVNGNNIIILLNENHSILRLKESEDNGIPSLRSLTNNSTTGLMYSQDKTNESHQIPIEICVNNNFSEKYTEINLQNSSHCLFTFPSREEVYGFGSNKYSQLVEAGNHYTRMIKVREKQESKVKSLKAGFNQTFILYENGELWGRGMSKFNPECTTPEIKTHTQRHFYPIGNNIEEFHTAYPCTHIILKYNGEFIFRNGLADYESKVYLSTETDTVSDKVREIRIGCTVDASQTYGFKFDNELIDEPIKMFTSGMYSYYFQTQRQDEPDGFWCYKHKHLEIQRQVLPGFEYAEFEMKEVKFNLSKNDELVNIFPGNDFAIFRTKKKKSCKFYKYFETEENVKSYLEVGSEIEIEKVCLGNKYFYLLTKTKTLYIYDLLWLKLKTKNYWGKLENVLGIDVKGQFGVFYINGKFTYFDENTLIKKKK